MSEFNDENAPPMTALMKVQDKSGKIREIGPEVYRESGVFTKAISYCDINEVCYVDIEPEMLEEVIKFSLLFKDEPPYVPIKDSTSGEAPPDDSPGMLFFQDVDHKVKIWQYIRAADYLEHIRMRDYILFHVCKQVRGSSTEKMRWFFDFNDPLDPVALEHKDEKGWDGE
uniref:BAH domain-containing protein n=1 Tax=Panagrellus redivivus TaxID=6233 RepID=A0A7E4VYT9_PANRE